MADNTSKKNMKALQKMDSFDRESTNEPISPGFSSLKPPSDVPRLDEDFKLASASDAPRRYDDTSIDATGLDKLKGGMKR
jgi:hypothetical protein